MRIVAIGDTHGRTDWMKIISKVKFDKIIFIGDYFDSHEDISVDMQINNFRNIIEYKRNFPNKVVLLIGNHEYHYLRNVEDTYSGYQSARRFDIQDIIHEALDDDLMQICYIHDNYLFTHAGITKTWLESINYDENTSLDIFINDLFKYKPRFFKFTIGGKFSFYGDDVTQSPIWVRPQSLSIDLIDYYTQVVGHTSKENVTFIGDRIVLIDTIGVSGEFVLIDNKDFSILNVNNLK